MSQFIGIWHPVVYLFERTPSTFRDNFADQKDQEKDGFLMSFEKFNRLIGNLVVIARSYVNRIKKEIVTKSVKISSKQV